VEPERLHAVCKRLGATLRRLRRRRGATQDQIAERAGLSLKSVGEIERGEGNPGLDSLVKLADALEVEVAALFTPESLAPPRISSERLENVRKTLEFINDLSAYYGGSPAGNPESAESPDNDSPDKKK